MSLKAFYIQAFILMATFFSLWAIFSIGVASIVAGIWFIMTLISLDPNSSA